MPTSSSTVNLSIAGLTEVEAGRIMARLRHMQSTGIISKEISIERTHPVTAQKSVSSFPLHEFTGL